LTEVKDRWRAGGMPRAWRFLIPSLPTGVGAGVIYRREDELRSHYFDVRLSRQFDVLVSWSWKTLWP
jgi:hypothetical protein